MTRQADPWFKFYPRDWLDNTRNLSPEERGAYIDHIAMQMINGGPVPEDYKWLAHQMHISPRKARSLIEALVTAKKITQTTEGLTNDRCEREIAAREHQRKVNAENSVKHRDKRRETSVKLSGNIDENQKLTSDFNEDEKISHTEIGCTRARLDTDTEIEEEKKIDMCADAHPPLSKNHRPTGANPRARDGADDPSLKFEQFWSLYPSGRKRGKGKARDLFGAIVTGRHRKLRATADEIIAAAQRYAATKPDPDYVPMPETWLNGGRWEDDVEPTGGAAARRYWWQDADKVASLTDDQWVHLITKHANGVWPFEALSYPPGHKLCIVPQSVIAAMGLSGKYDERGFCRNH